MNIVRQTISVGLAGLLILPLAAGAQVLVDDNFLASEGFVDGPLGGQNNWSASGWTGMVMTASGTVAVPQQNGFLTKNRFISGGSGAIAVGETLRFVTEFSFEKATTNNTTQYFFSGFHDGTTIFHPNAGYAGNVTFNMFTNAAVPEGIMKVQLVSLGTTVAEADGSNADYGFAPFSGDHTSDRIRMVFEATKLAAADEWEIRNTTTNLDNPGPVDTVSLVVTNPTLYAAAGAVPAIRFTDSDITGVTFSRVFVDLRTAGTVVGSTPVVESNAVVLVVDAPVAGDYTLEQDGDLVTAPGWTNVPPVAVSIDGGGTARLVDPDDTGLEANAYRAASD